MTWGERRCYGVRAAEPSAAGHRKRRVAARCETLTDTFPPAAPKDLEAVASEARST